MGCVKNNIINYSIIIPHKNIPSLLQRCIDSIPLRDDLEIIIVDDDSDSVIVDFNNFPGSNRKDVKIIFEKKGRGAGYARNVGVCRAKGKWLLFADSDDTYTENLSEFLDYYVNSDADVIYFKCNVVNLRGRKRTVSNMNIFIDAYLVGKGDVADVKYGAWEPWNKLIKRDFVINNLIKFDEISSSNDKIFSLKAGMFASNVIVSNTVVYNYILRTGSIIHSKNETKYLDSLNTIIRQNIIYHTVNYKRKVFFPYFLLANLKFINKSTFSQYWKYVVENKANPFEGLFSYFFYHLFQRLIRRHK